MAPIKKPIDLPPAAPGTGMNAAISTDDDLSACRRLISRAFSPHELPSLIEEIFTRKDEVRTIGSFARDEAQSFIDIVHEVRPALLRLCGVA